MALPDSERTSVPLGDAEVATWVARAVRSGRASDRETTLEMLLYTFRESAPTEAARARVKAALDLAGIQTTPDVLEAPPGAKIGSPPRRRACSSAGASGAGERGWQRSRSACS